MTRTVIDAHHHLWAFDQERLPWIGPGLTVLRRDYLAPDLEAALAGTGVGRTILVHAQQRVDETTWMLDVARRSPRIAGVVGWVPLTDPAVDDTLAALAGDRLLRGVRHIVHDEPDDDYLLREDFNRGVARLRSHGLVYDVLIFARHLPQAIAFVDRHPDQPFVVDHVAKPAIRAGAFDRGWADGIRRLAERPHVTCKLSGMVTEVRDAAWTPSLLQPYVDVALDAFGPDRLLFGTDWPVCRLRCEYGEWVEVVRGFVAPLSADEQAAILGGNAARVYGL
jgi:L-fuconolactonase